MKPRVAATLWAIGLAVLIHVDWHLARHGEGMSGHWKQHWLIAIPAFGALAVAVGGGGTQGWLRSAAVVLGGAFLGQILEPLIELATGASLGWAWGAPRWTAFAEFMAAGLLGFSMVMAWRGARAARQAPRTGPD